ncbi:MAG: hypothetical protein QXG00_02100 [Candidatus Woesearchaeota archaeon]
MLFKVLVVILVIFGLGYALFILDPSPLNMVANVLKQKDATLTCEDIKIQAIKQNDEGACLDIFTKNVTVRIKNLGEKIDRLMIREVNGVFFTNHVVLGENIMPGESVIKEFTPKDTLDKLDIYYYITQNNELVECKLNYLRINDIPACRN